MTGRELYAINEEQAVLHGLPVPPHWETLAWTERDRYEDMATEVTAADNDKETR